MVVTVDWSTVCPVERQKRYCTVCKRVTRGHIYFLLGVTVWVVFLSSNMKINIQFGDVAVGVAGARGRHLRRQSKDACARAHTQNRERRVLLLFFCWYRSI